MRLHLQIFLLVAGCLATAPAQAAAPEDRTAVFHAMLVEKDVPVETEDGTVLSANVFRPDATGRFPVIMTMGPYPKDIHFSDWSPEAYEKVAEKGPNMHWETANPDWWVPQGYVVVRVDRRGMGKSPGDVDLLSQREARDFRDAIEWAGTQPWSNGKVGLLGVSYFAMTQWRVAALQPQHLAAIIPWEGAFDTYRDAGRHGGIFSNTFAFGWFKRRIVDHQNGLGADATDAEKMEGLVPFPVMVKKTPLETAFYTERTPDASRITVPLLSAGNWGGLGLHLRGNVEGFAGAASPNKRLRMHTGTHIGPFYSLEGRTEQKRFFDHWLKGIDTGLEQEPPIKLAIRHGDGFEWRYENEWPLARTQWTPFYLDAENGTLSADGGNTGPATVSYRADADADDGETRVLFSTPPFETDTEITGPVNLKLYVSSSSDDMDIFAIVRNIGPDGAEVTFEGANNPQSPVTAGWLRASQRKTDPALSTPYRPFHSHDEVQKLTPGEVVPVEVEIWPTSMVFEKGHRMVLEIASRDGKGLRPFLHTDENDRHLSGTNTVHTGGDNRSHILLPVIPER